MLHCNCFFRFLQTESMQCQTNAIAKLGSLFKVWHSWFPANVKDWVFWHSVVKTLPIKALSGHENFCLMIWIKNSDVTLCQQFLVCFLMVKKWNLCHSIWLIERWNAFSILKSNSWHCFFYYGPMLDTFFSRKCHSQSTGTCGLPKDKFVSEILHPMLGQLDVKVRSGIVQCESLLLGYAIHLPWAENVLKIRCKIVSHSILLKCWLK